MQDLLTQFGAPTGIAVIITAFLSYLKDRRTAKQTQVDHLEEHLTHYRDEVRMLEKKHRLEMADVTEKLRACEQCCARAESRAQAAEEQVQHLKGQQ